MIKLRNIFNILIIITAVALFMPTALAQIRAVEICNGKDDDGDGQVDEGLDCRQHYLAYRFQTIAFNPKLVFLKDQFLQGEFKVIRPVILLNPVTKRIVDNGVVQVYPMKRPELHYIGYQIQGISTVGFPGAFVRISNQFETTNIKVDQPRFLLAPAAKKLTGVNPAADITPIIPTIPVIPGIGPVPNAEHYLCYNVEPKTFQIALGLKDQFQGRNFVVVERKHLCNPVIKRHGGMVFPADIQNKFNHLTCYRVVQPIDQSRAVFIRDQFGIRAGKAFEEKEVCLPTIKTEIHPM